jgi:RHS repeat-associated protein
MSLPRRDAARTRLGVVVLTAVLLLAAGIAPALARSARSSRAVDLRDWWHRALHTLTRRDGARLDALPGDTVTVFGPLRVTSPSGSQTLGVERFTATVLPGRQYLLEIARGDGAGGGLPTALAVRLNGSPIASETDFAGGVTWLRRVVALTAVDTVSVAVTGSAGATAQVKVLEIADPTVLVFGPQEFLRGNGQPETEIVHFTFDGRGGAPYRLCILNGLADGTKRTSSATIVLNGQTIVTQSDVNQQVGSLTRAVPLVVGDNVLAVTVASIPSSRVSLCLTAADVTPPVLAITAPAAGQVTKENAIPVSGTVTDQTATRVTVNGAETVRTGDVWSATLPLPTEGSNTVTVHAVDAAGNATDSVRTVIRDTEAPVMALDGLPDATTYRADSLLTVTGTITDRTAVTANVNGQALVIDSVTHRFTATVHLARGANFVTVAATDAAGNATTVVRQVTRDDTPPAVTLTSPTTDGGVTRTAALVVSGTASDQSGATVTVNGMPATLDAAGAFSVSLTLTEGPNTITILASDGAGNPTTVVRHVDLDTQAPTLEVSAPQDGALPESGNVSVSGTVTDGHAVTVTANGTALTVASGGAFSGSIAAPADRVVTVTATDAAGNATTVTRTLGQESAGGGLPPDPATVAPALDRTVATTLASSTAFLYSGTNPIQTGVAATTINPYQAAVIRGRLVARDGTPLPGVTVSVLNRPEFGQTISRQDGGYDLAVNGGEVLTLSYVKPGVLPAQRQRSIPRQQWVTLDDVALVQLDTLVTSVNLSQNAPVARGSVMLDGSGPRQGTLIFEQGTVATMVLPSGATQPLNSLSVRVTEYTVGPNGLAAMPAELPPASAYTYAVEFSVDEALAAGATSVRFSKPVSAYVENFIGFPVGGIVPLATYDRVRALWVSDPNGLVVRVLSTAGGLATLDVDGTGMAATPSQLASLGVTDPELARVAELYHDGQSLWRIPITHFSPKDANWPYTSEPDQMRPRGGGGRKKKKKPDCQDMKTGSIIGCERRTLGEAVAITGVPEALVYTSERTAGYRPDYVYDVALSDSVEDSLLALMSRILLRATIAGRTTVDTFPAQRGLHGRVAWDGRDAYGRLLQGQTPLRIEIGYVYGGLPYGAPVNDSAPSFGRGSGVALTQAQRVPRALWRTVVEDTVGSWKNASAGLGGWSLAVHHSYDPAAGVLYLGTGDRRSAGNLNPTLVGTGGEIDPYGLVTNPDGSVLYSDEVQIHRIARDGTRSVFAGNGTYTSEGDGGPATQAGILADRIARGPDGSIYLADLHYRIRKIDPAGIITTVAGTGVWGNSGDGGPALQAQFNNMEALAVGPDGSIYVLQYNYPAQGMRVRRIGPDGIVTHFAGTRDGDCGVWCADSLPALNAPLGTPLRLAVQSSGDVLISDVGNDLFTIWKVSPGGLRTRIVNANPTSFCPLNDGDGGVALYANACGNGELATAPDGSVYFAAGRGVRRIDANGIITTVAGNGVDCSLRFAPFCPAQPKADALQSPLPRVWSMAVTAENTLVVGDGTLKKILRMTSPLPGFDGTDIIIAGEDGSELYRFSSEGRHLATLDAITGVILRRFSYDSTGQLTAATDAHGNVTSITRDDAGAPQAIVGPFGHRTALTLDSMGYLATIRAPGGDTLKFVYNSLGLMTSSADANGAAHRYTYDTLGLLESDLNPDGLVQTLSTTDSAATSRVTITRGARRSQSYLTEDMPEGGYRRVVTDAAGLVTTTTADAADSVATVLPDGTVVAATSTPDKRFGMQAPVATMTITLPSGLTRTVRSARSAVTGSGADTLTVRSQIDSVIDNGVVSTSTFDAATHTVTTRSPEGRLGHFTLDSLGRTTRSSTGGLAATTLLYDDHGHLRQLVTRERVTRFERDERGEIEWIISPTGAGTHLTRDSVGRVLSVRDTAGTVSFTYDNAGHLRTIVSPTGQAHAFQYTPGGLLTQYTAPTVPGMSATTRYRYDAEQQLRAINRPSGDSVVFDYDSAGRPVTIATSDGATTFRFAPLTGQLTQAATSAGNSYALTYDGSLLTSAQLTGAVSGTVSYKYDAFFRPIAVAVNNDTVKRVFDRDGLLQSAGTLSIRRNPANGLVDSVTLGTMITATRYDSAGMIAAATTTANGLALYGVAMERDSLDRVIRKTETIAGVTTDSRFVYDSAGRLAAVSRDGAAIAAYQYDANGNRLARTTPTGVEHGVVDAQDRLTTYGAAEYKYTASGELAARITGVDTTIYHYDAGAALRWVRLPNGSRVDFVIDAFGRRVQTLVNGVITRSFLYESELRIAAELTATGDVRSRFIYGDSPNTPEYMVRDGHQYRLITDYIGSVVLVVDAVTDSIVQHLAYDEYGRVEVNSNPGFQPFGYAGGVLDDATGLVRYGRRDYDAQIGRFTSKDPSGLSAGANLYSYVKGDPINNVDPSGLWTSWQYAQHYFRGKGKPVDLAETGDLAAVQEASAAAMNQFKHAATLAAREAALAAAAEGLDSFSGNKTDKKLMDYKPVVFSLGHSNLEMRASFEGVIDWKTCTFTFKVHLSFAIHDMFQDPADIFNMFKKSVELPGGTPYQMNANWSSDYTGGGSIQ